MPIKGVTGSVLYHTGFVLRHFPSVCSLVWVHCHCVFCEIYYHITVIKEKNLLTCTFHLKFMCAKLKNLLGTNIKHGYKYFYNHVSKNIL